MLSFPGAVASLEQAVLEIPGAEVVGVQADTTIGAFDGSVVLGKLVASAAASGFSLPIFVGRFERLPAALRSGRFPKDHVVPEAFRIGPWFDKNKDAKFNVLELDVCCAFGSTVVDPLHELLADGRVADDALVLVNHMKGREKRGDLSNLIDKYGWGEVGYGKKSPDKAEGSFYRYMSIPQFYSALFLKNGFHCPVTGVYEYRDKNDTGKAVTMIQYFFRAKKVKSDKSVPAYKAISTRAAKAVYDEASSCATNVFSGRVYQRSVD